MSFMIFSLSISPRPSRPFMTPDKAARPCSRNRQAQRSAGAFKLEGNKANRCKDEGLNRRMDDENERKV